VRNSHFRLSKITPNQIFG